MCDEIRSNNDFLKINHEEALIIKYNPLIKASVKRYFLIGAAKSDLLQEATIAFLTAVRTFSPERNKSFENFAKMCIHTKIITTIKKSCAKKHIPLNTYISFETPLLDNKITNPETIVIIKEEHEEIVTYLASNLTTLENNVLNLYLNGKSYKEISIIINKDIKAVDNTIQRIRKKLANFRNRRKQG